MPSAAPSLLSLRHEIRGPAWSVSAACASGAVAIGQGMELLRSGAADLVLAGGFDSLVSYAALCAFLKLDVMSRRTDEPALASRPFDAGRDGFVMGEGAGFLLLQRTPDAVAEGRRILVRITGHAENADAHHLVAPHPEGAGALRCMRAALDDAGLPAAAIGSVNAHATGTVVGDLAEARALGALLAGRDVPVTAVKGTTGHLVAGIGRGRGGRGGAHRGPRSRAARRRPAVPRPGGRAGRRHRPTAHDRPRAGAVDVLRVRGRQRLPGAGTRLGRRAEDQRQRDSRPPALASSENRTGARSSPRYQRSGASSSRVRPSWRIRRRMRGAIMPQAVAYPRSRISR